MNEAAFNEIIAAAEAIDNARDNATYNLGEVAQHYARVLRWPVFPCAPRGKKPLTAHGFKDATVNLDVIRAWWKQWPDANIGAPTGAREHGGIGLDAIDIDGVQGNLSYAQITHAHCPPDCSATTFCRVPEPFDVQCRSWTPGDGVDRGPGRHLLIPATGRGNATKLAPGIDYRGHGGYIILPPSANLTGKRYQWITEPEAA